MSLLGLRKKIHPYSLYKRGFMNKSEKTFSLSRLPKNCDQLGGKISIFK